MKILFLAISLLTIVLLTSCGNTKNLQYLQGNYDKNLYGKVSYTTPKIETGDIISISVFSDNAVASALYNLGSSGVTSVDQSQNSKTGYLVDHNGNIRFHSLGNIEVKGLTCNEVAGLVADKLMKADLLKNAYCQVGFVNFKFTILGEVNKPSVFSAPNEKISILEALGLAGDLTAYGRRDSVMIIREIEQSRKIGWVDLRRTDIFNSEYFYLKQNDVMVVHPTKNKAAINDQIVVRNITLGASVISTIAIIISVLKR